MSVENRIKEFRTKANLSQEALGEAVKSHRSTIVKLESGEMNLTVDWMRRLSEPLDCDPAELLGDEGTVRIPVEIAIAATYSENRPDDAIDLPEPVRRIPAPAEIGDPHECFAAIVIDDSADKLYPPTSTLYVRRIDHRRETLHVGQKIIVRHYVVDRENGVTSEILVGLLDRTLTGDLVLLTRTRNRLAACSIVIQPDLEPADLVASYGSNKSDNSDLSICYEPLSTDTAEILGVVVMALTPQ